MALCVGLSVLLHVGMGWALLVGLARDEQGEDVEARAGLRRFVVVVQPEEVAPAFVKTDADLPEVAPMRPDFIGKRNAVESASELRPERVSEEPVPSQNGEESEELVTFDQSRQEGDLAYDGRVVTPERVPLPPGEPVPPSQTPPEDEGEPVDEPVTEGMAAVEPPLQDDAGDVRAEREAEVEQEPEEAPQVRPRMVAEALSRVPAMTGVPLYDPSLADHKQQSKPGFRTYERRTRSTGRFVIGKRPSLNVAATPQGRYEEEIYRRIAHFWYIACDEHRGDIIPGSVVVSLRINSRGLLENMDLVRRKGASVIQQSFTFGAIRRASLPPMPPAVRQEMVGDVLELIFHFNFD